MQYIQLYVCRLNQAKIYSNIDILIHESRQVAMNFLEEVNDIPG